VPRRHRALSVEDERIVRQDGRDVLVNPSITLDRFSWDEDAAAGMTLTQADGTASPWGPRGGGRAMSDFLNSSMGVALVCATAMVLVWVLVWRMNRRWWRQWNQEEAARERERALQRQLWELEDQIRRESLPDWQRQAIEEADRKRAAITQEARKRLGLPEEEA